MLNDFIKWFQAHEAIFENCNCKVHIVYPTSQSINKKGIYADIDTNDLIARATIWETGECDMEAIRVSTEERLFYWCEKFKTPEELDVKLRNFLSEIGCFK